MRKFCTVTVIGLLGALLLSGCAGDEKTAEGKKLYNHYCSHCHGESGQQAEGFNWERMPDPRPKNLASEAEMSTFSDEEIFHTISREMRDTSDPKVLEDMEYFAVPTMPTFKYTLSEEEIWHIVAYVRTLHGMSLTYDLEARHKELEQMLQAAQQEMDEAKAAFEAAQAKVEAEQAAKEEAMTDEQLENYEPEEVEIPEEEVFLQASVKFDKTKAAFDGFLKRPKKAQVPRPDLTISEEALAKQVEIGKAIYSQKYGCHGCHSLNDEGGLVGPALDRAGFRLNPTWIYRWILYPQSMKKHTRMPNLGISTEDAKALTYYLGTLRAPKSEAPVTSVE
ncbi:MAG: c-type cytochrome [Nitrospirales bacterium]|nr:cytochrome c [Nitrospirales bacterium]